MTEAFADVDAAWRPPPKLTLSEWADEHYRLPSTTANPGKWHTLPYQRGIMDAITDPAIERVSVMKSARVGYTQIINAAIAYHIHHDPCSMMVVQPTVPNAETYSKESIAPMLRAVDVLAGLVKDAKGKDAEQTLLHKTFPGGLLGLVGANSGTGFRMVERRIVYFDEVDGYPASAGNEGDPIKLGEQRTATFWNRKIIAGSTPLIAGASRIEEMFEAGDQRRFYVPCPHCGHMDFLRFSMRASSEDGEALEGGHVMRWDEDQPETACFQCAAGGCVIEESDKHAMLEAGEWRAAVPFAGDPLTECRHASFHIWAAYSTSPNATWAKIAAEFLTAKREGPEKLKTFVNTWLGETWKEKGEAPAWEGIYDRREPYVVGFVHERVRVLTCGVDVQKDRFVFEVVGWAANKENWSIDAGEIHGDTALEETWAKLDAELLERTFSGHQIRMLAIDSGAFTQQVYNWTRTRAGRVMAIKGANQIMAPLLGAPTPVEVNYGGKRIQRGCKVWHVGGHAAKTELYSHLRLRIPEGEGPPPGYCHFPDSYGEEFFRQLTAEHLVIHKRAGRTVMAWEEIPNRQNHALDARVYARAAAVRLGLDRLAVDVPHTATVAKVSGEARVVTSSEDSTPSVPVGSTSSWLQPRTGPSRRPGGWLGRRR